MGFQALFDQLPPHGPKRNKPMMNIQTAVMERDTFRLVKMAEAYGLTEEFPYEGLLHKPEKDLSSLPDEIDAKFIEKYADEFAQFCSNAKNPLLGKYNANNPPLYVPSPEEALKLATMSPEELREAAQESLREAADARVDEMMPGTEPPGFVEEERHCAPPNDANPAYSTSVSLTPAAPDDMAPAPGPPGFIEDGKHSAPPSITTTADPAYSTSVSASDAVDLEAAARPPVQLQPEAYHAAGKLKEKVGNFKEWNQ